MPKRRHIRIDSGRNSQPWAGLLPMLENLLPVKLEIGMGMSGAESTAVVLKELAGVEDASNHAGLRTLAVPRSPASPSPQLVEIKVTFSNDAGVPFPFQGRSLQTKVAVKPEPLSLRGGERVLATCNGQPAWVVAETAGAKRHRSGFVLPEVGTGTVIKDVLNEQRFLEMLPLVHWLRELCADTAYGPPPLRACFIFDDPNLHWTHYGFVDFQEIAQRAARLNYHVTFATIPLDAWYAHAPTVQLFKNNRCHLSLTVHGNDHTRQELAQSYTPEARVSLLRQAIHRIERLESKTGLAVCRVMVPPHGACSEAMLAELPGCGFEAACISHGSLRAHNQGKSWTRDIGYLPSELVQDCPVLPRWGFSKDSQSAALLAAFLGQPLVFRGHHQDLKNGVELLDEMANFINGLGSVSWSNLTDLCRMNYQAKSENATFRVSPLGSGIILQPPEYAAQLAIESLLPNARRRGWKILGLNGTVLEVHPGEPVLLTETFRGKISIVANDQPAVQTTKYTNRPIIWPLVRRLLAEGRDRFLAMS